MDKPARFKYLVGLGSGFILQDLQGFRNLAGQDSSFREIYRAPPRYSNYWFSLNLQYH